MPLDFFLVAKENAVSFPSETWVIDGCASLVEISCMAARPDSQDGNRYPRITGTSGIRCTWTVTSVITPSRPSEPSTISRTPGAVDVWGSGRTCNTLPGMTTRGLIFWSVQAAGDIATSAVRDDHRVGSDSAIDDQLHLILIAGTDHDVRQSRHITARIRSRSRSALPYVCTIRSRSSCTTFSGPTASVSSAQLVADHGRRDRQVVEGRWGGRPGIRVKIDSIEHEGPEGRLVLVVKAHSFDSPTPPLHVLDVGHPCRSARSKVSSATPGWRGRWWRSR
jgi:hypothetical protein